MNSQRIILAQPCPRPSSRKIEVALEMPPKPWKLPPQTTYVFKNANVVDVAAGVVLPGQRVMISDGRISRVSRTSLYSPSDKVVVIDLEGKFLCPGLIDCHAHLSITAGSESPVDAGSGVDPAAAYFRQPVLCQQMLSRGFTTVRDMGGATYALKEAIEDDIIPGPRLFICNETLSKPGGYYDPRNPFMFDCCVSKVEMNTVVDGVSECIRASTKQLRKGADFIKMFVGNDADPAADPVGQFTADEIRAIVDVAKSRGTYVTAYAHSRKTMIHAVENGVKGLEHCTKMDPETAKYMASKKVWLIPASDSYKSSSHSSSRDSLQSWYHGELARTSLSIAHIAGIKTCYGSNSGSFVVKEMRNMEDGVKTLNSKAVLQSATVNAAEMLGEKDFLGQVKEKFAADLLVLNENPLVDATILSEPWKHVLAVIKNGRVYVSRWSKLPQDVTQTTMIE